MSKCVIALDVSGSMTEDILDRGICKAQEIAETLGFDRATFYAFDTEIRAEVEDGLRVRPRLSEALRLGGGGTDVCCLFERLKKWAPPGPALVIVVSDLLSAMPAEAPFPGMTTIWLDMSGEPVSFATPSFGLVVRLGKEEA